MPSGAPMTSCHCFTLCSARDARLFLAAIPASIERTNSPWAAYLTAVYGKLPPLPVSLKDFTYFYHNDGVHWPSRVENVLATCKSLGQKNQGPVASPHCGDNACSRWRAMHPSVSALHKLNMRRLDVSVVLTPNGVGYSSGAIIVADARPAGTGPVARDKTWVEGIRFHSVIAEGVDGYGCWFGAHSVGSGIWLNVGRTVVDCAGIHGQGLGDSGSLRAQWQANTSVDHGPAAHAALNALRRPLGVNDNVTSRAGSSWVGTFPAALWRRGWRRETAPFYARALGYDTIQCAHSWSQLTEIVAVHPSCMHRGHPIGGCAPSRLGLRIGWTQSKPCVCDEPDLSTLSDVMQVPSLNCRGVARPRAPGNQHSRKPATHHVHET